MRGPTRVWYCRDVTAPLVVGLGRATVDLTGVIPRFPEQPDAELDLSEVCIQVGGGAAVAMGTMAALGCRARLHCTLADDFLAGFIRHALRRAGIDLRAVVAADRQMSGLQMSTISRDPPRRLGLFSPGDCDEPGPDTFEPRGTLDGAAAVLIDGAYPRAQAALAERANIEGVPVIFDGSQLREGTGALVGLADVLICSERLAAELAPRDNLEETLVEISRLGPRAVIITLGDAGAVGLHGDTMVQQAALRVACVDSKGAGAIYHGAFAAALLSELPFAECMEFASAAAGLSCATFGAWAGIPDRDAVVEAVRRMRDPGV
jgi:sulfofructose kinase